MRALLVLVLVAAAAAGGEEDRLGEEERAAAVRAIGEEAWGALPPWRQRVVLARYALYLRAPERKREAIERVGLREFLLQAPRPPEEEDLPPSLAEAVARLPPDLRPLASRLAFVRLRQLRLDRGLSRLPFAERREVFRHLFPEPFDPDAASAAVDELRHREARAFARALREGLEARAPQERRDLVRRAIRAEEERIVERVRGEIARLEGADPERAKRVLERFLAHRLENLRFVTPRQRELIRYAVRPEECPLVDPGFLGEPPEDPAERRLFERDFRTLARLDLLSEAGFGREMVLHLAGAGSEEDFLRAVQALRRPPGPVR